MAIDINALEMLPAETEGLAPCRSDSCLLTCLITCLVTD